jgi:hypothetical protein
LANPPWTRIIGPIGAPRCERSTPRNLGLAVRRCTRFTRDACSEQGGQRVVFGKVWRRPCCEAHHVVWNAWAGELWRRTTIALSRALRPLGNAHGAKLRISYGKVAEYQRRGVVHFHALIRLDAVDEHDPDAILAPPPAITAADLARLVSCAVRSTTFDTPGYADTGHTWPIAWGRELDVRPVGNLGTGQITSSLDE